MNGQRKQRLRRGRKAETMLRARNPDKKRRFFSKTERLKQALETADAVLIGAGAGFPPLRDLHIPGNAFTGISVILKQSTVFMICIPAAFMLIPLRKSTGRTGAGISRSTVMKMPQGPFTIRCTGSYPKKIILYSRPMWTTVFRKRVLIKNGCFTHRAITVYSSAASRVTGRPMITGPLSCAWWKKQKKHAHPHRVDPAVPEMRKAHGR